MANNPSDGSTDDFLEQILGFPSYPTTENNLAANDPSLAGASAPMMLQLSSGDASHHLVGGGGGGGGGGGFHGGGVFPLGLSLDQGKPGFMKMDKANNRFREDVVDGRVSSSSVKNAFPGQTMPNTVATVPHPPSIRPRVRARRGQATDPHSIAERVSLIVCKIEQFRDVCLAFTSVCI
ncbi:hypothetical protein CsSME_00047022 [Camellia sinensis var. sinensis]